VNGDANRCEWCNAAILWVIGPRGGRLPIDAKPSEDGTVFLQRQDGQVFGGTVTRGQAAGMRAAGKQLHEPHRFTCPEAERWTKAKDRERRYRGRR